MNKISTVVGRHSDGCYRFADTDECICGSIEAQAELQALLEVKDAAKIIVDVVSRQHDIPIGECPHGNAPVYPSHGRWCDQCFDKLEDALSELERLTK